MRRILAIGWGLCLALGTVAVFLKPLTGRTGMAVWAVLAASVVAGVVALFLRRGFSGVTVAVGMAVSALSSGGGLGMLAMGIATHRSLPFFFAMKWVAVGFLLTLLFRREVIGLENDPPDSSDHFDFGPFAGNSPEEARARFEAMSEEERDATLANFRENLERWEAEIQAMHAVEKRRTWAGVAVLAIGLAVIASSAATSALVRR